MASSSQNTKATQCQIFDQFNHDAHTCPHRYRNPSSSPPPQCQICNKFHHEAHTCPHRYHKPFSHPTTKPTYISALPSPPSSPSPPPPTHPLPPPLPIGTLILVLPHTEQNGIAERKNCHIRETSQTLLHHSSLPPIFWLEGAVTAAYLINRLPTKTLHMASPYQKLYLQSPSYLHLKTFGCLYYPWTAYSRAHKLDPKSSLCIFIGYSSDHKGYRCFDPAISKLT